MAYNCKQKPKGNRFKCISYNFYENVFEKIGLLKIQTSSRLINLFYDYITQHNKIFDFFLVRCDFKLVFNNDLNPHSLTTSTYISKINLKFY